VTRPFLCPAHAGPSACDVTLPGHGDDCPKIIERQATTEALFEIGETEHAAIGRQTAGGPDLGNYGVVFAISGVLAAVDAAESLVDLGIVLARFPFLPGWRQTKTGAMSTTQVAGRCGLPIGGECRFIGHRLIGRVHGDRREMLAYDFDRDFERPFGH
jgi:hypothetical protein